MLELKTKFQVFEILMHQKASDRHEETNIILLFYNSQAWTKVHKN